MTNDLGYLEMMMISAGANKKGTGTPMGKDRTKMNGLMGWGHAAMEVHDCGKMYIFSHGKTEHPILASNQVLSHFGKSDFGSKCSHQPLILLVTRPLETRHLQAATDDCDWKEFAPSSRDKSGQKCVHRDMLSCSKLGSGRR